MTHRAWRRAALIALATLVGAGCAALREDMQRAEASYEAARYEDTLVWLRDLEADAPAMELALRARYFYLRGMTEYRLGHRAGALHYLAVAREIAAEEGADLRPEWRQIMERTLEELTPRDRSHRPPAPEDGAIEATETAQPDTSGGERGASGR